VNRAEVVHLLGEECNRYERSENIGLGTHPGEPVLSGAYSEGALENTLHLRHTPACSLFLEKHYPLATQVSSARLQEAAVEATAPLVVGLLP